MASSDIRPYRINIPQSSLEQVHQKLSTATFPDELDDAGWDYGTPLADIKNLAAYWRDRYDWRKHEEELNQLPQFTTGIEVDGFGEVDIHFVWKKADDEARTENAVPLMFVHGWPGSFIEVTKLLPLLMKPTDTEPAFDVVALSLPNFGFSAGIKKKGFTLPQYAEVCNKLMLKLGYNQYVTQAGDWGFWITRTLGRLYPQHCVASHINMIVTKRTPSFFSNPLLALQHALTPYTEAEKKAIERSSWFAKEGFGYNLLQSTKPQTLGYALADSPVAVLAWIYEKLHDWTDEFPWTADEILTWVSIYVFSRAGPAANARIYYEAVHEPGKASQQLAQGYIPNVKLGLANLPKDPCSLPRRWGRALGPIVYENKSERGGHFAAYEMPESVAKDLITMFGKSGGAFGVVKGRSGY